MNVTNNHADHLGKCYYNQSVFSRMTLIQFFNRTALFLNELSDWAVLSTWFGPLADVACLYLLSVLRYIGVNRTNFGWEANL